MIFKAYDVRGIYPTQLNKKIAQKIGNAFARFVRSPRIIIGQDMRLSSPELASGFMQGVVDYGKEVMDIGLVSTDALYYASGKFNLPGVMVTASHNPPQWNGFKFCRKGARPISYLSGLEKIEKLSQSYKIKSKKGKRLKKYILPSYRRFVISFIDKKKIKKLKVAVDAGGGMAGKIIPFVFEKLPIKVVPLYFKLDGHFSHHLPNPMVKKNTLHLRRVVKEKKADIGIAFDGDADRAFFVDERGRGISGATITALIAKNFLEKYPGSAIVYDLRCSKTVPEIIKESGGRPIKERVGHSFIKATMKKQKAVFGGEFSGHYYYRDNFFADSGIITALLVLEILSRSSSKMSQLVREFQRYYQIEEVSFKVADKQAKIKELKEIFSDGQQSFLDGLTVEYPDWWFNVRPSNTESVLRLNLEAKTFSLMRKKKKELVEILRKK